MGQSKQKKEVKSDGGLYLEISDLASGNIESAYDLANILRTTSKSGLIGALYSFSFDQGVSEAALNYATFLEAKGCDTSALEWFEKAYDSGDHRAAVAIAQIYRNMGDLNRSIEWYRRGSGVSEGALGHSRVASSLGLLEESVSVLMKHAVSSAEAASELVTEHDVLSEDEALNLLEMHWARRLDDEESFVVGVPLGNLLSALGDTDGACQVYKEAVEHGDAHAAFNLGLELMDLDGDQAIGWIRKAKKMGDTRAKRWLKKSGNV